MWENTLSHSASEAIVLINDNSERVSYAIYFQSIKKIISYISEAEGIEDDDQDDEDEDWWIEDEDDDDEDEDWWIEDENDDDEDEDWWIEDDYDKKEEEEEDQWIEDSDAIVEGYAD
ncbi:MAG: hypothetical protein EZS28_044350 [Streblomastix strix]|uniref:Uncharacterized protein n=1 Tax=Streblomastix strix TaxID=222440 RepID=A0A5J4TQC9_9EUKA|nr:MAG: hypothetical protein EZS28_044350 [Streblomastix strix]